MKKRIHTLLFAAVFFLVCIALCGIGLYYSRTQVHTAINEALREAERLHYDNRLTIFQTDTRLYVDPALKAYLLAPVSNRKIKSYTLQTMEKKTTYVFQDSLPEATARKLLNEYLLDDIQPLNVEKINQLFQEQLAKRHISGMAGVFYTHAQTRTKTRAGILPSASAYRTPVYQLDLAHNLQLQGWTDYDLPTLLRHVPAACYGALCLVWIVGGIYLYFQRKKQHRESAKGLYIDLTHQVLLIDGIQCGITRLDLQILRLLWEKQGECVNRETVTSVCWPDDTQADEKLEAHIQSIRKVLQDFPDYRIVTVKGRGYYLKCTPTGDSPRCPNLN